jgi:hypothetical protein
MKNFWILDAGGLITIKRGTPLNDTVKSFARKTQEDPEGETLVETVRRVWDLPALLCVPLAVAHCPPSICDHAFTLSGRWGLR